MDDKSADQFLYFAEESVNRLEEFTHFAKNLIRDKESVDVFLKQDASKLFGIVRIYRELFERLGISSCSEFNEVLKKWDLEYSVNRNRSSRDTQSVVDRFFQIEVAWDMMMSEVENELNDGCGVSHSSTLDLLDIELINAESKESVKLNELEKFERQGIQIIVIAFFSVNAGRFWLSSTKCPFPLLLDTERNVYSYFSVERSFFKTWNIRVLFWYLGKMLTAQTSPGSGESEDLHQMGADVILDNKAKTIHIYRCQSSLDRPSAQELLNRASLIKK